MKTTQLTKRLSPCPFCGSWEANISHQLMNGCYVKCINCQLTSVDPFPDFNKMKTRAFFWADRYHTTPEKIAQHFSIDFQKVAFDNYLNYIQGSFSNGHLLDFGCGIGGFVSAAQNKGWNAYGIDISPSVEVAKAHQLNVIQGSYRDLNFQPGFFDVITLLDVIEHICDLDSLLDKLTELLRPEGCLFIVTPNLNSLSARVLGGKWESLEPEDHVLLFTANTLANTLKRKGLVTTRIHTMDINLVEWKHIFSSKLNHLRDRERRQKERRRVIAIFTRSLWLLRIRKLVNLGLDWTCLGDKLILQAHKAQKGTIKSIAN